MITLCALLLTFAGAALVYLASARQRLRIKPLRAPARAAGWLIIFAGTACWLLVAGTGAGIAAALTALMLTWVALPYLAWWRTPSAKTQQP
ncbi:hypothetical protein [Dyella sp. 20L07]|uniref:hypothetical protein n=1 Tax=Dyella sp. 20L07 TaxID=3384240 RepID=UPI003D2DA855